MYELPPFRTMRRRRRASCGDRTPRGVLARDRAGASLGVFSNRCADVSLGTLATRSAGASLPALANRPAGALAVLVLLALALPSTGQATWTTESPVPTYLDVRGVAAPTAGHVFIATADDSFDDGGALFETTDGGASWTQRDIPTSLGDPLHGLFFFDALHGWTWGNRNYRTTDGGATWTELPLLGSAYAMEFFTTTFGLTTGNFGAFASQDGGLSWNPAPEGIVAADFAGATLGLGVSDSGVHRTTDGGANFATVYAGDAAAVAFLDADVAVAIVDGSFVRSTNGGVTWNAGGSASGRYRLTAVSADVVLAWGSDGGFPDPDDRFLRSSDGGATWSDLGEVFAAESFAVTLVSPGIVVGTDRAGSMYRSMDAGATWTETYASAGAGPSYFSSAAPAFADELDGYFAFGPGVVIRTTDGGGSWTQISSGAGQSINDLARLADGRLVAVGESGTLLRSEGGIPWTPVSGFAPGLHLMAVDALGGSDLVVADEDGRVHRSSDGGATWTAGASAPFGLEATDLDFATPLDGWVIGSGFAGAALFHTTDGGDSWSPGAEFQGLYTAVDFEGTSGWAANYGGLYYRTTDDGASWIEGELPGTVWSVQDVDFFDVATGYAVGGFGYAARSDDGGASWEVLPTPDPDISFTDIHLLGPNELWLSTNSDRAYYSATGGQSWAVLPIGSNGFGSFAAIVGTPEGDAWVGGFQGYIEKFDGPPPPPLNRPPDASFTYAPFGLHVDFTDTSVDPDGTIVSWVWDFGDGNGSTEQHPSHTYAAENTYIVRLTVTDDDGDEGSTLRIFAVQPLPGGTFGDFTEVTPFDPLFLTPENEDFWVATTAPADYDNDGDLDIAVLGYYVVYNESVDHRLVLLRNQGETGPTEWEFSYVEVPLDGLSAGSSDLAWGDVDDDGDLDLAVATDGAIVLYRNDGSTLVPTDTVLPAYWEDNSQAEFDLRSLTWADYDNDADLDLLVPSVYDEETFSFRTVLLRNDGPNETGGWNFVDTATSFPETRHAQSTWADFDDDGDLDLLLVHLAPLTDDGFIRRFRNDGDAGFVGEDLLGALTVQRGDVQWGDYDEDGDFDLLVAGNVHDPAEGYFNVTRIYRNDAETYVPVDVIDCIPCDGWFDLTAATWADYDSDGDVDILLAGTYNSGEQIEGRARIYRNDGGVFTESGTDLPAPRASASRGGSFTWLDLDGDLDLDYFIAGEYFVPGGNGLIEAQMHVYRNDAAGQNQAPSRPTGLTSSLLPGGAVGLAWNPSTDDDTPSTALTYDLEVFRNGIPLSLPRRLPEPGNVSAVTQWVLADLPVGTYRWSLRAVDSAYNGGQAAAATFVIGNPADVAENETLRFETLQATPNPFTGQTAFRFALPAPAAVTLRVYDVHGRLVATLADGVQSAGLHEIPWRAERVASGTYFARFASGDFSSTERVLVVR